MNDFKQQLCHEAFLITINNIISLLNSKLLFPMSAGYYPNESICCRCFLSGSALLRSIEYAVSVPQTHRYESKSGSKA